MNFTGKITHLFSLLAATVLLLFSLRRWLFLLAALWPGNRPPGVATPYSPPVLLLVPVRNEAAALPGLLRRLAQLDYPAGRLVVAFINDGSTDGSETLLQAAAAGQANWHLLSLPENIGKAAALNAALDAFSAGDLVVIFDADERPHPAALRHLAQPFANPAVGGVSGRRAVNNDLASPAASYTAFEGLVHQFITLAAKDRLNLAPALLGANCAYRRAALRQVGGFTPGALLEDTDLTVRLARAGWRTRFTPAAVSRHQVPQTVSGYWRQHTRWARGFNDVARAQGLAVACDERLSLPLRLELLAFALGYLDRPALLAAVLLAPGRRWLAGPIAISLISPLLQIVAALKLSNQPAALWLRLGWVPFFFGLDAAMAVAGVVNTLRRAPRRWEERRQRR
ncbi:MAG: hypothetical protein Kow0031_18140 [Anaerolineae bacterium]